MTESDFASQSILADSFSKIRELVDTSVLATLNRCLKQFSEGNLTGINEFSEQVRKSVSGGKRFRGLGVVVGAAIANAENSPLPLSASQALDQAVRLPGVLEIASALEFYQAAALVHDDIVDRSSTRRGRPSLHQALSDHHWQNNWSGDSDHFGISSGIFAGDMLIAAGENTMAKIDKQLGTSPIPQSATGTPIRKISPVFTRFSQMSGEVAIGQYLDLSATHQKLNEDAPDALKVSLEVVRLKSARYSVVHPVTIGYEFVSGLTELSSLLEAIFEPAGIAFQLRDDELGIVGDPQQTGKSAAIDIAEKKRTVLLALADRNSTSEEHQILEQVYSSPTTPNDEQIEQVKSIIVERGLVEHERLIKEYLDQANEALSRSTLSEASTQMCQSLFFQLTVRRA